MKKVLSLDTVREIKKSISRYLSILVLSTLAVAFLCGLRTTAPDMKLTVNDYLTKHNMMDIRILGTLGLTGDDVTALSRQPNVLQAEGAYVIDGYVPTAENDVVVKIHSISPTGLCTPVVKEGRMPEKADECVAERQLLKLTGFNIGDRISLNTQGDFENALSGTQYTIVGIVESPYYLSIDRGASTLGNGQVSGFLMLLPEAFSLDAYTEIYLRMDGASQLMRYSKAYEDQIDAYIDKLEPLGKERAEARREDLVFDASDKLADAEKELSNGESDANKKLADARQELDDARKKLDDGWTDLGNAKQELITQKADAQLKIDNGQKELDQANLDLQGSQTELGDALTKLNDGEKEYQDGLKKYEDGLADWQEGKAEYDKGKTELSENEQKYQNGLKEYEDGQAKLADAEQKIKDGEEKLKKSKSDLEYGIMMYNAGKEQLDQTLTQLTSAQQQLDQYRDQLNQSVDINALQASRDQLNQAIAQMESMGVPAADPTLSDLKSQLDMVNYAIATYEQTLNSINAQQAQLDGGWAQYKEGASALELTCQQLQNGTQEYEDGLKKLDQAKVDYDDGVKKLADSKQQLDDARKKLDDGWAELASSKKELDDGWAKLADANQELDDARRELDQNWEKYRDGLKKYEDGQLEYKNGVSKLDDSKVTLEEETSKAQKEIDDGEKELLDKEEEYTNGLEEYKNSEQDVTKELSDARKKLDDAKTKLADMSDSKWYILGLNTNPGFVSFGMDADRIAALAGLFPVIFFLVAALVCLTSMTRMVEEQRTQIGALKALGYGKVAIASKYLWYGLSASFLGSLLGLVIGRTLFPKIIYTAWQIIYHVPDVLTPIYPGISILCVAAATGCTAAATLWACISTLRASPAELMRPRAPKPGKRVLLEQITPIWKRLTFTEKVTLRNLFRYKKRFWMTVIGIGGCTALIITGFGLRSSLFGMMGRQYDEIYRYQVQLSLQDNLQAEELHNIETYLNSNAQVQNSLFIRQMSLNIESPVRSISGYIVSTPSVDGLSSMIVLRQRKSGKALTLDDSGVIITEKLAELLNVTVGDTIILNGDTKASATITGITENYIQHYVYMTDSYYKQIYDKAPTSNSVIIAYQNTDSESINKTSTDFLNLSGVSSVRQISLTRVTYQKSMESVDYAVVVIIVSAAALAFVVLYNLTNINITERVRELATIKVLGFYDGEVSAYVYRENIILTLIGIALGLVMGKFLHQWLVATVEIEQLMFVRQAPVSSYTYAALLTCLFTVLVNVTAHFRLKKIDMVESLKTME